MELGGTSIRSILCKSAPKEETTCGSEECSVCTSESNKRLCCRKATKGGVGYDIQCMECLENGNTTSVYHGETSRTLYTRAKEHLHRGQGDDANKPLIKHLLTHHPDKAPNFDIKPVGFFQDVLTRQINEGVRINNSNSDQGYLMNSKSEFRQGEVPRIVITRGINT